ncbi:hypothetical protein [Halosimplex sp. J119]
MHTINETDGRLPTPPISADEITREKLPTRGLDDAIWGGFPSIKRRAEKLAKEQNGCKTGDGVVYTSLGSEKVHLTGKVGEIVAADILGVPLDNDIYPDGDPGYDSRVGETTLDIKTTATDCSKPKLIVAADDTPSADYFILVHIADSETCRVIGFADRETVLDKTPRRWPGQHTNYIVDWDELYPPQFFRPLVLSRSVLERGDRDYIHPRACQLCGAHLDISQQTQVRISSLGRDIYICNDECHRLLKTALEQGTLTDFTLYKRPAQA